MTLNLRVTVWKATLMSTTRLPVLFLTDLVVLPGMVLPIELDDAARAAVDAAKAHSDDTLLVAPRLEDRYASFGVANRRR
jgi:ATP-dependent Lon protease